MQPPVGSATPPAETSADGSVTVSTPGPDPEGTAGSTSPGGDAWRALIPVKSPLDELRLSDDDERRLYETWQAAMATCMREKGFEMEVVSYDATAGTRSVIRTPIEPSAVEQYGYHLPPEAAQPDPMGANERRAQHDPAFMEALFGTDGSSRDGCRGEQFDRVYNEGGDFWQLDQQIGNAQVELSIALDASTRVQQLDTAWSACMSERGFDYEAPDRPASLFAGKPSVTPTEIATRQADIACQLETRYVETTSGWLAGDVQAWLDANAQTVNDYLSLKDDYLRNLAEIRSSLALS
ncbi:MAG: hypothetical protein FGM29_08375 [Actinobacteria bacterium]|nr:hypothetical protein [Actinomycetota bacterium]